MRPPSIFNPRRQQTGSTLIISLIILIMVMMLCVTAMVTSQTQYKLAGNLQFEDAALNNAETAIAETETWLATGTPNTNAGLISDACASRSVAHLYPLDTTVTPPAPCLSGYASPANDPLTMGWDNTNSVQAAATSNARHLTELLSTNNILIGSTVVVGGRRSSACNKVNTYRITARGISARGASKFVQSYYSVLNC